MRTNAGAPIDTCAWIGGYPYRDIPHPEPDILVRVLEREGFGGAWVGHLPGAFQRDPAPSNRALFTALSPYQGVLHAAPMVRPDWPGWEQELARSTDAGAAAIRIYPAQWGLGADHPALRELSHACALAGLPLLVTVRFEDLRQRHHHDVAGDVPAATLRALARLSTSSKLPSAVLLVAGAGRELIEEVHWGLNPVEQAGVFYDFHWVWGPPEHHLAHLVRTLGPERLVLSSWWPLRLTQQVRALLELLPLDLRGATSGSATSTFGAGWPLVRFSDGDVIGQEARKISLKSAP